MDSFSMMRVNTYPLKSNGLRALLEGLSTMTKIKQRIFLAYTILGSFKFMNVKKVREITQGEEAHYELKSTLVISYHAFLSPEGIQYERNPPDARFVSPSTRLYEFPKGGSKQ